MGSAGSVLIKEKNVSLHRSFETLLFTRTDADWSIKLILSSFLFSTQGGLGYPDGLSDCGLYTGTINPAGCIGIKKDQAYVKESCGYTMKDGGYTRVHRDLSIINAMRGWVGLATVTAGEVGIPGCT